MALYVIIPTELALELHEPLRHRFRGDRSVHVIVERRGRRPDAPEAQATGRRVEDAAGSVPPRRVVLAAPAPESLPPEAAPYANRLRFFTTMDSAAPGVADVESLRLVSRYQRGDQAAFDDLYRRHFPGVYNYARMALTSATHAEDVAQQVFLRALQALPRYRAQPEIPFRAWLLTIARREVLRVLARHAPIEVVDPVEMASMPELRPPERWSARWLTLPEVADLVEALPRRQQQVLMLRYAIGLSVRETATVMSTTENAINSLRRRALEQLRAGMQGLGYAPANLRRRQMPMRRWAAGSPVLARRRAACA